MANYSPPASPPAFLPYIVSEKESLELTKYTNADPIISMILIRVYRLVC